MTETRKECKLTYEHDDLFKHLDRKNTIAIAHICNDVKKWGAGFVIPLGRKFPSAKAKFLEHDISLGRTQLVGVQKDPTIYVANMYGQHNVGYDEHGNPPIRYSALTTAMQELSGLIEFYPDMEILAPKFGAGLAGGNWDFIEILIKEIWIGNGIPVTIYVYP
jgi:hypothetical protein